MVENSNPKMWPTIYLGVQSFIVVVICKFRPSWTKSQAKPCRDQRLNTWGVGGKFAPTFSWTVLQSCGHFWGMNFMIYYAVYITWDVTMYAWRANVIFRLETVETGHDWLVCVTCSCHAYVTIMWSRPEQSCAIDIDANTEAIPTPIYGSLHQCRLVMHKIAVHVRNDSDDQQPPGLVDGYIIGGDTCDQVCDVVFLTSDSGSVPQLALAFVMIFSLTLTVVQQEADRSLNSNSFV